MVSISHSPFLSVMWMMRTITHSFTVRHRRAVRRARRASTQARRANRCGRVLVYVVHCAMDVLLLCECTHCADTLCVCVCVCVCVCSCRVRSNGQASFVRMIKTQRQRTHIARVCTHTQQQQYDSVRGCVSVFIPTVCARSIIFLQQLVDAAIR
jgi:hypothetical protein